VGGLCRFVWLSLAAAVTVATLALAAQTLAPGGSVRRATRVDSLLAYGVFYNQQPVRVRGTLSVGQDGPELVARGQRVLAPGSTPLADPKAEVELTGTFVDVGRLAPDDTRLAKFDLVSVSRRRFNRDWPGAGELLVLLTDSTERAEPFTAASVRALALAPDRYAERKVTVGGRFRGRNLFGDLPAAPGRSRWDFVLQLADSAIWVVGRQPKGRGFDLNPENRADTGRWLEVEGDVQIDRGLVWLEAIRIDLAQAQTEAPTRPPPPPPPQPAPAVTFSIPADGDTDVETNAAIRVQFSRDMAPDSFKGHIEVEVEAAANDAAVEPAFTASYDKGKRALTVRLAQPLPSYRTVKVTLTDGIAAVDGQRLVPFVLSFTTGSG
jgi:hypothetical protein